MTFPIRLKQITHAQYCILWSLNSHSALSVSSVIVPEILNRIRKVKIMQKLGKEEHP